MSELRGTSGMNGGDCERLRELAAELALGVLPARERAEAVAHLDRCPDCREYVERLTLVGDGLLGLLPGAEPPVGFETRVTNRLAPARPEPRGRPGPLGRPRPRRRLRLAVAAAAAALACGFGGWAVGTAVVGASAPSSQVQEQDGLLEAALVSGHHEVGRIFAHPGTPGSQGWVYMSVDLEQAGNGTVHCRLVRADGTTVAVGSFALRDGYGYWGAPVSVDPATVTGARLLAEDGSVLATARF
ncbi:MULTISPECIES: zf-HC2 domain-containing protein [Streptomyces]|uniref:Zf-HC2 domain-containing protein n=1 Tax=Streptomyces solicathayae TaxID=3081768 RepID=A0ABZ0LZA7_9ACTN|nr:zf-HC2 domain-containing protein [Streptomyces sp. HUAS YS2]WOX24707.1 zf-HC2 domain-containing protein [Streptomyces sp. HUAS YS2]